MLKFDCTGDRCGVHWFFTYKLLEYLYIFDFLEYLSGLGSGNQRKYIVEPHDPQRHIATGVAKENGGRATVPNMSLHTTQPTYNSNHFARDGKLSRECKIIV